MFRKIVLTGILLLCMTLSALADARFAEMFYEGEHEYALEQPETDVFVCLDEHSMDEFQKMGTGIVLFGSPESSWTRASVELVQELCGRYGIGVIRYANPAEHAEFADEVQAYISRWGTSFANVSGTAKLIEENIGGDAKDINGVVLFVNKGNLIGVHVGTSEDAEDPMQDVSDHMDEIMEQMHAYVQKLGTSPCPNHC